jgi:tryptophan 6-halogenase
MFDIKKIVIVGGGTAGILTAAILSKVFKGKLKIDLIYSDQIPTIGVGESSTASLQSLLSFLGLDEKDWMSECNAVYKYGGKFMNWSNDGEHMVLVESEGKHYINDNLNLHEYLVSEYQDEPQKIYDIHVTAKMANENICPKFDDDISYAPKYTKIESLYSYNFDARKFAEVLKQKICIPNGVNFIKGDLKEIKLDSLGFVEQVKLMDKTKVKGDLYVDCTGFRSSLIEKAMGEPFISFGDSLFCDKAVVAPIQYKDKRSEMNPFTSLYTMTSGWLWKTPIFDRIGSGYVYSSKHISDEDAEKEFRAFNNGYDGEVMNIRMRIGTRARVAVKNVIACGLSSGFAEPMESTGISTFQGILSTFVMELEQNGLKYGNDVINAINNDNIDMMIDIRDFILAHYYMCPRNDTPFWQDVHTKSFLPDTFVQKLQVLAGKPPSELFRGRIFGAVNWFQWLWAMGYYKGSNWKIKEKYKPLCEHKIDLIKHESESICKVFPNMYDYLKEFYGRD